jgi:hypothetical protein
VNSNLADLADFLALLGTSVALAVTSLARSATSIAWSAASTAEFDASVAQWTASIVLDLLAACRESTLLIKIALMASAALRLLNVMLPAALTSAGGREAGCLPVATALWGHC